MIRPIREYVLITPDPQRTQTRSGLQVVEDWKPETSGTVVAVGPCPHPLRQEAIDLAARLRAWASSLWPGWIEEKERVWDAADLLDTVTYREPAVRVGERVVFPWQAGQELWVDEARYLLLREDEILAVVEPSTDSG